MRCSSGLSRRFRPLGRVGISSSYQRQGTAGRPLGSPPLPVVSFGQNRGSVLRQRHGCGIVYLRKEGGTRSPFLNSLTQGILRWSESLHIRLALQFIPGSRTVLADALSCPHQLPSSEWSFNLEVFLSLRCRWPVQIDLFATSENRRCSIYFSPIRDPQSAGTDAFLQSWDGLQAYAFPPWSIIPRVLAKLRMSRGTELTLVAPYWPQRPWFPDLLQLSLAPPVVLPNCPDLLFQHRFHLRYQGLHKLQLHAWRLSGVSPERPVSHPL